MGKKDGKLRPVVDYRKLNSFTIPDRYPLPLIQELVDKVRYTRLFTKLDVRAGYNNIRFREGDKAKAAFKTNMGLFEPTVMPFRLRNALAVFQRMMNTQFADITATGKVIIYMDDILIARHILFIFCTAVLLLIDKVWGDSARYWSQESSEGLAKFLMSRGFGDIGSVRGEDDIFNGIIGRGIHGLNGVRNGEDVWFPGHPYMRF